MMMRRRRRRRRRIRRAFGPGRVRSWVCWFVTPLIFPPQWDPGAKIQPSMIVPLLFFRLCWRVVCRACSDMPVEGQIWYGPK